MSVPNRKPAATSPSTTPAPTLRPPTAPRPRPILSEVAPELALVREPKRRRTAFLLCLFLGWLGAHRYYVGKTTSARIYLLTSGLLFAGVVVDLGLILAGSFRDRFDHPLV